MQRSNLGLFTSSLGNGGAEKHLLRLANHMDRERFRLITYPIRGGGSYERQLAADVSCRPCVENVRSSTLSAFLAAGPLSRMLDADRCDLLFSVLAPFHAPAFRAVQKTRRRPKLVLGFQNNLSANVRQWGHLRRVLLLPQIEQAIRKCDHIIALSRGVACDLQKRYPVPDEKLSVIYNAAYDEEVVSGAGEALDLPRPEGPLLVACGRLSVQKDYPTMLRAFARVCKDVPATLWILGEGPLRGELEALASELGICRQVDFLGFRENPFRYMAAADLFVLSSAWEGFGNVIVEALACGTPVVSTACPFGPSEILNDGQYGSLVPVGDDAALAAEVVGLLDDVSRREALAHLSVGRAREFASHRIAKQYGEVFSNVLEDR